MERISDKMFVKEIQLMWKAGFEPRKRLGKMLRDFFGEERASRIIQRLQDPLEEV